MVLSMIVYCSWAGGAEQSCRVTLGPEARDAVVLLAVLQVLCCDTAHQRIGWKPIISLMSMKDCMFHTSAGGLGNGVVIWHTKAICSVLDHNPTDYKYFTEEKPYPVLILEFLSVCNYYCTKQKLQHSAVEKSHTN